MNHENQCGDSKPFPITEEQISRFWTKVEKGPSCWPWTGKLNPDGYGEYFYAGKTYVKAHRVSYGIVHGNVPVGNMVIDHICRNRKCVNPEHLRAVTVRENTLAGVGIAATQAKKTHCIRGHEFTPGNTKIRKGDGCRECLACMRWRKSQKISPVQIRIANLRNENAELKQSLNEKGLPIYALEAVAFLKSFWKDAFQDGLNIHAWKQEAERLKAELAAMKKDRALVEAAVWMEAAKLHCYQCLNLFGQNELSVGQIETYKEGTYFRHRGATIVDGKPRYIECDAHKFHEKAAALERAAQKTGEGTKP